MYLNISFSRNGKIAENENNRSTSSKIAEIEHEDSDRWSSCREIVEIHSHALMNRGSKQATTNRLLSHGPLARYEIEEYTAQSPVDLLDRTKEKYRNEGRNIGIEEEESKSFLGNDWIEIFLTRFDNRLRSMVESRIAVNYVTEQ